MDTYRKNLEIMCILSFPPERLTRIAKCLFTWIFSAAVLVGPCHITCQAATEEPSPFISLQKRLVDVGFNQEEMKALYDRPEVTLDQKGISAYFLHRESTLNYDQFLSRSSIKDAKRYRKQHQKALQQATARHGVPDEVIIAILLVESRLGTHKGKRFVFNTLSNLAALGDPSIRDMIWEKYVSKKARASKEAFDKWSARKSKWAFQELQAYITYVKAQGVDPFSMRGSLAGALGHSQFVPTSVLRYGKDGNDDGKIDLYQHQDAIESIANYLERHGWKPGQSRDQSFTIILRYNNSKYYADTILKVAERIATQ